MVLVKVLTFAVGLAVVVWVLLSAVRTMVVPRGEQVRLTRWVFLAAAAVFGTLARHKRDAEARASLLAKFAPTALLALAVTWAVLIILAFVPMYWALGEHSLSDSISLSGSSLTTLGFVDPLDRGETFLTVAEALLGLGLVALLISYLPTIYGLFNRREVEVLKLDVRAGSPPTALEMLTRFHRIGWIDNMDETWAAWEDWFSELEESHTSHPSLVFFRSQRANSSWITGAGAVLDTAAISLAAIDRPWSPNAAVTIRAGFMCLQAVAGYFGVPFDPNPAPNDPISIHREEFDLLLDELDAAGLPLKPDREQAWRDFAGWRVNYDRSLLGLCVVCNAPPTPWSSDRVEGFRRATLLRPMHVPPIENGPSY